MGRAPAAGTRRDFLSGNDTQPIFCGSTGSWDAPPRLFVQAERGDAEDRRAGHTTNAEPGASVKTIPGVECRSSAKRCCLTQWLTPTCAERVGWYSRPI